MKLKCLGSGSSGNCYLLSTDTETLILDCGIPIMEIKKGLNFDLSKVVGCVVTHDHADHSKSVNDLENMGIRVWKPYKYEVEQNRVQRRYFGSFTVRNFDVPHDDEPCCGFIIENSDGERLLYATDFEYIKYSFRKWKIHYMLIEANCQKQYVNTEESKSDHVLKGHAELETTIGIVKDNLDRLKTVILCHLSKGNANPEECKVEVEKVAKFADVHIAEKGLEVDLKLVPFI